MTDNLKCKLCCEKIGLIEKFAYFDMVWHKECLIVECLSDYVGKKYGEFDK